MYGYVVQSVLEKSGQLNWNMRESIIRGMKLTFAFTYMNPTIFEKVAFVQDMFFF